MLVFHINRFQVKLLSILDVRVCPTTIRAGEFFSGGLILFPAILTFKQYRHASKVQGCTFGNRPIAEDVPEELDRIVHDGRPLSEDQMQDRDAPGVLCLGMANSNFEQAFGDCEFVHGSCHYTAITIQRYSEIVQMFA